MRDIQKRTAEMTEKYGLNSSDIMMRYADLVSEVGELGKELVLASDYGTKDLQIGEDVAMELGDVVFCLALLANAMGLDLEECFAKTAEKCERRFDERGRIGS